MARKPNEEGKGVLGGRIVLAVYFPKPLPMDSPFTNKGYFEAYALFSNYCSSREVDLRIVRGASYSGGMRFSGGWCFDQCGKLEEVGPFIASLILNKSGFNQTFDENARVLNHPFLENICSNKLTTYKTYPSLIPYTIPFVPGHLHEVLDAITSERIVFKPCLGAAGRGIYILKRSEIADKLPLGLGVEEPYLAQEFVESKAGIPGVVEGRHDVRLFIFDGVPHLAYIRKPKGEALLANIAKGGSMQPVEVEKLPNSVLEAADQVDTVFAHCRPRFYSADFMYEESGKPYLIELNSKPGFPSTEYADEAFREAYFHHLYQIVHTIGHD